MKKYFKYLFTILLFIVSFVKVDAMTVSKNELTLEKGKSDSIELYANVEVPVTDIEFTLVYTTYDIPANFFVNPSFTDTNPNGIKHSIKFEQAQTGKILLGTVNISAKANPNDMLGTINIHTGKATAENGEIINLNRQDINVKIGTPIENNNDNTDNLDNDNDNDDLDEPVQNNTDNKQNDTNKEDKEVNKNTNDKQNENKEETVEEGYNLLKNIESKIVNIEIKENIFEYTITIDKEVLELDLNPVAINDNSKIDITTQKVEELKDNKILITVKDGEKEQIYTINVRMLKDFEKAEIDNSEFEANNSYKGKWLVITIILIVCLIGSLLLTKKR